MSKNVIFVLTSHDRLGDTGHKTGFWLEELAAPYYALVDSGYEVTLASPKGGKPPLDPKSNEPESQTEDTRRFLEDDKAVQALSTTVKLSDVTSKEYDAVFYPGGHGPLWDLVNDENSIALIQDFWRADKPVTAVCHAPIVLANVETDDGDYLVDGKNVTGFTNSEEDAVGLTEIVPLLVEDTMVKRNANFIKVCDFEPHVIQDGNLITGQNPASSKGVAEALIDLLR